MKAVEMDVARQEQDRTYLIEEKDAIIRQVEIESQTCENLRMIIEKSYKELQFQIVAAFAVYLTGAEGAGGVPKAGPCVSQDRGRSEGEVGCLRL